MPEGDSELPDDGLPDELEEDDEDAEVEEEDLAVCAPVADLLRLKTEDLP